MRVIIQAEKKRYTIPVPYFMLRITVPIICSKWFWRFINNKVQNVTLPIPLLDKQTLKLVLSSLKEHKGLTIVDIKDKDENGVVIRL